MDTLDSLKESLRRKVWITKGARFNAHRRLLSQHYTSIFTISILSFYSISIGIFSDHIVNNYMDASMINKVSIFIAIFILVLSLLEASKGYELRAERLHKNATELGKIHSKIAYAVDIEEVKKIADEYHEFIVQCPENHSPIDDKRFRAQHPEDFNLILCDYFKIPCLITFWYRAVFLLYSYWIGSFFIVPPIAIYFLI